MPQLTGAQKKLIRQHGMRLAGTARYTLELGKRYYCGDDKEGPFKNWLDWNLLSPPAPVDEDTDLSDVLPWSVVTKLNMPQDADLDFYVYSRGLDGELKDNLEVMIRGGKVVKLYMTFPTDKNLIWEGEV